jgi:coenzyme F420 hydrogenase subunit beta
MVTLRINGLDIQAEEGWTILDAARFMGIAIPTFCFHDGLSPWGGCRLCIVEIEEGRETKLVSACTYPVNEGLIVNTHSKRVIRARKVLVELLLSICPTSKTIQDLAAKLGVQRVRFKVEREDCIYCGLCVRICSEQMGAKAIGFVNRGGKIKITTPFDRKSEECIRCGACMYICPTCQLRCEGPEPPQVVCGGCLTLEPTCLEFYPT